MVYVNDCDNRDPSSPNYLYLVKLEKNNISQNERKHYSNFCERHFLNNAFQTIVSLKWSKIIIWFDCIDVPLFPVGNNKKKPGLEIRSRDCSVFTSRVMTALTLLVGRLRECWPGKQRLLTDENFSNSPVSVSSVSVQTKYHALLHTSLSSNIR